MNELILQAAGYAAVQLSCDRIPAAESAIKELGDTPNVGALLLVAGKNSLDFLPGDENADQWRAQIESLMSCLGELEMPIVCAVACETAGPGACLALACDVVVAAASASFQFTLRGGYQTPVSGASWLLPRLVGPARAAGMLLLADKSTAKEAEQKGMIWKCVPDDRVLDEGNALAAYFAAQPAEAMRGIKKILRAAAANSFDKQLDLEGNLAREIPRP